MGEKQGGRLICVMLAASALLAVFAVIAQPNASLLTGLWKIQISEAGLITDPMAHSEAPPGGGLRRGLLQPGGAAAGGAVRLSGT